MTERDESLRDVRQLEYVWIPMRDGARLAARVWLPVDAESDPVPAILEAVPYRLSDGTATRDARIHPYWAARGYACVRVDLRGSGESDGVLEDEYHPQEQDDLLEVIAWIAAQPWCSGGVGMTGISWGGFNSLQLAARRPPALRAVITLMSTDDRYADDVHYKGGCVLATDLLHWSTCMLHWQCQPPHEAAVGERWRELWEQRLASDQALDPHLARAPAARRLLEARLGVRGLRGHRGARVRDRGLDRRVHEQRPAPARGARRAAQGPHRPVAPRLPARRHARPGDRVPPGGAALVGPLAQGRGHRRDGRAACCACGCRSPCRPSRGWTRCRGAGWRRTRGRLRGWSPGRCGWTRTGCCAMRRTAPRRTRRRRPRTARTAAASPSAAPSSAAPTPAPGAPRASRATSPPTSGRRRDSRSASPRRRCRGTSRSSATRGSRSASRATGRWRWSPPGWTTWRRAASPGSSPRRSST